MKTKNSIKQQTVTGLIWTAVQKFGSTIISFASNIVLARLLCPSDYGCVGMLAIFITLADTFIDGGFGAALIQKKEPTEADYSTMFYWNLLLSFGLYFLLFACAPAISRFYNEDILTDLLRVQGITLIVSAFGMVQRNQIRKQLKFKSLTIIHLIAAVVSVSVAITMAFCGFGVWSLVAQRIVSDATCCLLFWFNNGWKPKWIISKKSFKELFSFGSFLLLSNLVNKFFSNIQGVLIGKFFAADTMGLYSQAGKLETVSSQSIAGIVDQVAYPVLAKVKDDKNTLISAMRKFKSAIAFVTFPLLLCLMVVAKPLIILLFSEKWVGSVPYFQILCISGIAMCIQAINYYAVMSTGRSKAIFRVSLIRRCIGLGLMLAGYFIAGIWGLMIGMVLSSYLISYTNARMTSKYLGYGVMSQIRDILPTLVVALIAAGFIFMLNIMLSINMIMELVVSVTVYIIVYLLLSYMCKLDSFVYFKETAEGVLKRR